MDRIAKTDSDDGAQEVSLTVEETNKLRIQLGLKPLEVGPSKVEREAKQNYQEAIDEAKKRNEKLAKEHKEKRDSERRFLRKNLSGRTLAAVDDAERDDAAQWVQRQRQQQQSNKDTRRKPPRKSSSVTESSFLTTALKDDDYDKDNENHGVLIGHAQEEIREGEDMILTLADKGVLDEDGNDVLENSDIRGLEYAREKAKSKLPAYSGYDDDQYAPGATGRSVLAQYDDVIDPGKRKMQASFKIDLSKASHDSNELIAGSRDASDDTARSERGKSAIAAQRALVSLDFDKFAPKNEYLTADEVKISRKKSKAKKHTRQREEIDPNDTLNSFKSDSTLDPTKIVTSMPVSNKNKPKPKESENFVDDEDLQSILTIARHRAIRARATRMPTFEEIEDTIRDLPPTLAHVASHGDDSDAEENVFDTTKEFVSRISTKSVLTTMEDERAAMVEQESKKEHDNGVGNADATELQSHKRKTSTRDDVDDDFKNNNNNNNDTDRQDDSTDESDNEFVNPLDDEPELGKGIGSAMELFRKRGTLENADQEKLLREKEYAERLKWGVANPVSNDKSRAKARQRAKDSAKRFQDYTPNVNLDYYDDKGRLLTTKEAYILLSHRFHGRSSGKNKQEKLQRKLDEKKRMMSMSGGDTPLHLASAMIEKQKALGTPGILLTVGNRPAQISQSEPPKKRPREN